MIEKNNNNYVKWATFTFIIGILMGVAVWFANLTNNKLDKLTDKIDNIDRRTSFLEGLNANQKTTFKNEINNILSRMYGKDNGK